MSYVLTKLDLAALHKADSLCVYLRDGKGTVRATKKLEPTVSDPFARDIDHMIAAPVRLRSSSFGDESTAVRCFAGMTVYRGQDTHISAVLSTLRVGDGIAFEFCPDYMTTQNLEEHGFHGDVLRLVVTRGKRRLHFEIDHLICPDNTARMIQNFRKKEYSLA